MGFHISINEILPHDLLRLFLPCMLKGPKNPHIKWLQLMSRMWGKAKQLNVVFDGEFTHLFRDMRPMTIIDSVLRFGPVQSWTPFLGGPGPGPVLQMSEKGRTEDWTT